MDVKKISGLRKSGIFRRRGRAFLGWNLGKGEGGNVAFIIIRMIWLISSYMRFLEHCSRSVFTVPLASRRSLNNSELVLGSVTRSRLRFPSLRFLRVYVKADKFSRREIQNGLHHRAPQGGRLYTQASQIKY